MNKISPDKPSGRNGCAGARRWALMGFSVVELIVTLSLTGILAALAVPSYQGAIEKRQITESAEQIVAFVSMLQSESVKRNRRITVSYAAGGDGSWCMGAAQAQTPCDCMQSNALDPSYCAIDSVPWLLRESDVSTPDLIQSVTGDGAFVVDPVRGTMLDPADGMALGLRSTEDRYGINLSVASTGKISLCLPQGSENIPGFVRCAE